MIRPRNLDRWAIRTEYDSLDDFMADSVPQVHSINHNGAHIDLLVQDRGAPTTLVSFHASLSKRVETLPSLQGTGIAADTGCNLISLSDPALEMGDLNLGWFLGDKRTGSLPPILAEVVHHVIEKLGSTRTILFGASGGGYAAVLYGEYFPGEIVLAVNPRLDLGASPSENLTRYLNVAHEATTNLQRIRARNRFAVVRLREKYGATGLPFDLCLYQNVSDRTFMRSQARPFIKKLHRDPNLHVRFEDDGQGHVYIPGDRLRGIVRELSNSTPQKEAISKAGFMKSAKSENIL